MRLFSVRQFEKQRFYKQSTQDELKKIMRRAVSAVYSQILTFVNNLFARHQACLLPREGNF
jgi:hypothetical protein